MFSVSYDFFLLMVLLRSVGASQCLLVICTLWENMYLYIYGGKEICGSVYGLFTQVTFIIYCLVILKKMGMCEKKANMWKNIRHSNKNNKKKKNQMS